MSHIYPITVKRDGRFWLIFVPAIEQYTQARRVNEIRTMARELIALSTSIPLADIQVAVTELKVAGLGDVTGRIAAVKLARKRADDAAQFAQEMTTRFALDLCAEDVTVRDIGELVGLAHARVSQLTSDKRPKKATGRNANEIKSGG